MDEKWNKVYLIDYKHRIFQICKRNKFGRTPQSAVIPFVVKTHPHSHNKTFVCTILLSFKRYDVKQNFDFPDGISNIRCQKKECVY